MKRFAFLLCLLLMPTLVRAEVAVKAEDVKPIGVGETVPSGVVQNAEGQKVELKDLYESKPTVLVFYRGGWCPYCNKHLSELGKIEKDLLALGYQIIAVSPDRPELLKNTQTKTGVSYQLYSDSAMDLTKSFGLAFKVDDETIAKYKTYNIDLEKSSGQTHHLLPVPAAYVLDKKGKIHFVSYNPNYKERVNALKLLQKARIALNQP